MIAVNLFIFKIKKLALLFINRYNFFNHLIKTKCFVMEEDDNYKMCVAKEISLKSIQQKFNQYYPFLKIEFFKIPKETGGKMQLMSDDELRKKKNGLPQNITIDFNNNKKVHEIETELKNLFGFPAQMFRRLGNVWVETSLTQDWTVEEQNTAGKQISLHFQ